MMRRVRIKVIDEDIKSVVVDDEHTGMTFTANDINAMVEELLLMPVYAVNSREDIIAHLVEQTLVKTCPGLSAQETEEAVKLVIRDCRRR